MSVVTSSSSTTKEPEDIMICLDNSCWMESNESPMFMEQAEAIELYCSKKINSHSENTVGVAGMSEKRMYCLVFPTRNLSKIMNAIYVARIGGYLLFRKAVSYAYSLWFGNLDRDKQKRLVVFAGGAVYHRIHHMEILGEAMKRRNLACDVINFGDQFMDKKKLFNRLIDIVDNNGNCNICHVPPELSVCEALSRSQIIIPRVGGSAPSAPSASLLLQHDSLPLQHDRAKQTIEICVKAATGAPDVLGECPFCQRVLLTLEEKKLPYVTRLINMENKPEWFVEVNPDGIVPLIKFDDEKWVSNSDVIVEMIDEKYPKPALLTPPQFASLGLKILPKVGEFIKCKGEKYGIEQDLLDELEELDKHLLKHGPYVNGRKKTAVDLSLAPKLYHLEVALGHFKKWAVPETLTHVHMYTKSLFNSKSFKKTKPSEYHVIAGWEAKVNPSSHAKPSE